MPEQRPDPEEERNKRAEKFAHYRISPDIMQMFRDGSEVYTANFAAPDAQKVILEINLDYIDGIKLAHDRLERAVHDFTGRKSKIKSRYCVFASLTEGQLVELVRMDSNQAEGNSRKRLIHKVWPDKPLDTFARTSIQTIKADACIRSFGGGGQGIVWAVLDSGIDGKHPHFKTYHTLGRSARSAAATPEEIWVHGQHQSFLDDDPNGRATSDPLDDVFGHGTHVAGIIAGATPPDAIPAHMLVRRRESDEVRIHHDQANEELTGVAPRCKLISMKVLDKQGRGNVSALLAAIDAVSEINGDGRRILIHGVNISIGYNFDPEWYASGQSPVCVAVNRLVRTGVVVVVAAGNAGSAVLSTEKAGSKRVGLDQSIGDPGNADLAITVGSTHAEAPHTYGISYFSSRGPTTDGRDKPDLVAPGERIVSCASAEAVQRAVQDVRFEDPNFKFDPNAAYYIDDTGTSMAAPHVSGVAAIFLSIHHEFIGQPEKLKEILLASATDLKRKREYQGAGLVDLMRAVQSV